MREIVWRFRGKTSPISLLASRNPRLAVARQLADLRGQPCGFRFQSGQLRIERGDSLCRHGIEQAGLFLHELRQLILRAFAQAVRGFEHADDLQFQTLPQPPQLRDLLPVAEVEAAPALPENETVRVVGDLAQRGEVAGVPRMIDRAGQLLIGFELCRLISAGPPGHGSASNYAITRLHYSLNSSKLEAGGPQFAICNSLSATCHPALQDPSVFDRPFLRVAAHTIFQKYGDWE